MSVYTKILETEDFCLHQYQSDHIKANLPPLLITFALVNTPDILDISPKRSFINHLTCLGFIVYLIIWKLPKQTDINKSLEDYIQRDIDQSVKTVHEIHQRKIILAGICQGGYFNLCYAALDPTYITGLITLVTPVDFHVSRNRLYQMIKYIDFNKALQDSGNIPGQYVNQAIFNASPFLFTLKKLELLNLKDHDNDIELIQKIEKWAWNCPSQAKKAFLQFVSKSIQENALVRQQFTLDGQPVLLSNIELPILNIVAKSDPIWPIACTSALAKHIAARWYKEYQHPGGHIGVMVSRLGLKIIPALMYDWTINLPTHSVFHA